MRYFQLGTSIDGGFIRIEVLSPCESLVDSNKLFYRISKISNHSITLSCMDFPYNNLYIIKSWFIDDNTFVLRSSLLGQSTDSKFRIHIVDTKDLPYFFIRITSHIKFIICNLLQKLKQKYKK